MTSSVITAEMAAVTSTNCTVCEAQSIVKTAAKWCSECDEFFCPDCLKYHSNAKSTKRHAVIDISDLHELPEVVLNIKHHCKEHGALFQNYCLSHEQPCCRKCINSTHKNCTDLPPIDEAIKDARSSIALGDIQERLQNLKMYLGGVFQEKETNAKEIKAQSKIIIEQITSIRLKLNQDLDCLEREILQKVSELTNDALHSIEKLLKDLKGKQDRIDELYNGIITMKNHASELQVFLGTKEFELEVSTQENEIEKLPNDQLILRSIVFQESKQVSAFSSKLVSYFGDVVIEIKPLMTSYLKGKEQQAQNSIQKRKFKDIELKLVNKLNFKGKFVFGSAILENDTVCFADPHSKTLSVSNINGDMLYTIGLPIEPYDIVLVTDQTLAVTTAKKSCPLLIVNVKDRLVEKTIQTKESIFGISFADGKLICNSSQMGLISVNLENGIITKLEIGNKVQDAYVAVHVGKIYCTNSRFGFQSVQCYNANKTLAWEFRNKSLCGPRGIAVDKTGIVYVGNQDGGNVILISLDGSEHKTIKIDSIHQPRTLRFNKAKTRLLICGQNGSAGIFAVT